MNKNLSKILLLASIGAMPLGMAAQQASSFVFSGKVKDIKGKGIAGVVVNNGRSFVQTNSLGEWTLPTASNASCHAHSLPEDQRWQYNKTYQITFSSSPK